MLRFDRRRKTTTKKHELSKVRFGVSQNTQYSFTCFALIAEENPELSKVQFFKPEVSQNTQYRFTYFASIAGEKTLGCERFSLLSLE